MNDKHRQMLMVFALVVYFLYLAYRAIYTLNPDAPVMSAALFAAECYGWVALFLFSFQVWQIEHFNPPKPPDNVSVDVFVTTYNEDVSLLRKTLTGCIHMHYPHETYLLDDGNRAEMKALAEDVGAHYIARKEHINAKAGNVNNALAQTNGELVAMFDSDHVPKPDFLTRTLGFFRDPKVALVQTPEFYYNLDAFVERVDFARRKQWDEQEVFHHLIQPCKNHWNSAFFCGTCAVLRRKALDEMGGLLTDTITEDLHTSIKMHANGWKSIYHDEHLTTGLAAGDIYAYHTQRRRWAQGNLNILAWANPLTVRGLTLAQRISYFGSIFHWTGGFPKLIFYLIPALMLLTSRYPVANFDATLVIIYIIYLTVALMTYKVVSRGTGRIFEGELFSMTNFFTFITATLRVLVGKDSKVFKVTAKQGTGKSVYGEIIPQMAILFLCYLAIWWGVFRAYSGVSAQPLAIGIGTFWTAYVGLLAAIVVRRGVTSANERAMYRFVECLPVLYHVDQADGSTIKGFCMTADFNERGMRLLAYRPLPVQERISLSFFLYNENIRCNGTILYAVKPTSHAPQVYQYGVKFEGLSSEQGDKIAEYAMHYTLPKEFSYFKSKESPFRRIRTGLVKGVVDIFGPRIYWSRLPVIFHDEHMYQNLDYEVTDDLNEEEMEVTFNFPHTEGQSADFTILTPVGRIRGRAELVRQQETMLEESKCYTCTFRFQSFEEDGKEIIQEVVAKK